MLPTRKLMYTCTSGTIVFYIAALSLQILTHCYVECSSHTVVGCDNTMKIDNNYVHALMVSYNP